MYERFTTWRKSTRSSGGDNCVEVSFAPDESVGVRDSKNREGGVLAFASTGWRVFIGGIRDGDFDR